MKKIRLKTSGQNACQNREEVIASIRELGDRAREIKRLQNEMNENIVALQEKYATDALPHQERIEALNLAVQTWCEANRQELTDNGRVKFADFATGIVKWRNDPPKVTITGVQAVLALLRNRPDLTQFIRTKEEINKEAILNEREHFEKGQVAGIKIVEGKEQFVIEPYEQII